MDKRNCYRIKAFLEDVFRGKRIEIKVDIIDKFSQGLLFWRMRIKIPEKRYKHLLNHIYNTAYSMCALTGEYLDKKKTRGCFLYLS